MLTVNIQQDRRNLTHLRCRAGLTVDFADAASSCDFPYDQDLSVHGFNLHCLQGFLHLRILRVENQFHQRGGFPLPDHLPGQLFPQRQVDGTDQNRFSRAGLTGKDVQSRTELYLRLLDQRKIFYM